MINEDLYRFYHFNLLFYYNSILLLCRSAPGYHKVNPRSARHKLCLLAFIPDFLSHTASSICQCQVTVLINRSVLAAVGMRSCVVEARGRPYHLSSPRRAFPPTEPLAPDVFAPATYEDKISVSRPPLL